MTKLNTAQPKTCLRFTKQVIKLTNIQSTKINIEHELVVAGMELTVDILGVKRIIVEYIIL